MNNQKTTIKSTEAKLIIEQDHSADDYLLTYGSQRIFIRELEQKMTTREWGKKGIGLGNRIVCELATDEREFNIFRILIDQDNEWDVWGDQEMIKLVKKYGLPKA